MTGATSRPETGRAVTRADGSGLNCLAGRTVILSGIVGAVGVAFLVAMFGSFAAGAREAALVFGRINDVLVLGSYLLVAPSVLAVRALLRPVAWRWGSLAAVIGLAAIAAIVALQFLLISGTLTFEEQVGPVSIALLVLGGWFVVIGRIGSASGVLPGGTRMGLLAASYVGYPIWAFWLGRRLESGAIGSVNIRPYAG